MGYVKEPPDDPIIEGRIDGTPSEWGWPRTYEQSLSLTAGKAYFLGAFKGHVNVYESGETGQMTTRNVRMTGIPIILNTGVYNPVPFDFEEATRQFKNKYHAFRSVECFPVFPTGTK